MALLLPDFKTGLDCFGDVMGLLISLLECKGKLVWPSLETLLIFLE
jgi:hypothetical protein